MEVSRQFHLHIQEVVFLHMFIINLHFVVRMRRFCRLIEILFINKIFTV